MSIRIRKAETKDAGDVANLHIESISSGFISSLGLGFSRQLYKGICGCESAFCLVARKNDKVLGFIAGAESVGGLYKSVLLRRGLLMSVYLARFIFSARTIKKIFQTLLYPSKTAEEYPPAEVLSVAVTPQARRKGVGRALMQAAMEEFRRRGIDQLKVAVAESNGPANRYYVKEDFQQSGVYDSHNVQTNIYVRTLSTASKC